MTFLSSLAPILAKPAMQVVAGLLSGVVGGGALVASGAIPFGGSGTAAPSVALTACPGSGPVLTRVADGEALLVTGRSADGAWLEVYVGQPGVDRGWAPAAALQVEAGPDALPVADCSGPSPVPLGSPAPTASAIVASPTPGATPAPTPSLSPSPRPTATPVATPTATPSRTATATPARTPTPTPTRTPTPTPKPTPKPTPAPTPAPTPTPDTTAPSLSNLIITSPGRDQGDGYFHIFGPSAYPCTPSATIKVTATDPDDAVSSVRLLFEPLGGGVSSTPMTKSGTTWVGILSAQDNWSDGLITYWVTAADSNGNQSQLGFSNSYTLYKGGTCIT